MGRYFTPVGDISTFTRYFHNILLSESYVCQLHRRMQQTCAKNVSICSILRKLSAISLVLEIFRRFNAISIALYTPIAAHAVFSVESIPTVRKMRPFTPFWRKLSVISILFEIFRRVKATSIALYTPNATHASFIVDRSRPCEKCDHLHDFEENCALFRSCWKYFDD